MSRVQSKSSRPPTLSRPSTLTADDKSTSQYSLVSSVSGSTAHKLSSHQVWIEVSPGRYVIHKVTTAETEAELQHGRIPKEWYKRVGRTLSTIILAATFMAGVEAQILCLLFSALPTLEKTMAVCFSVSALFLTSLSALYCAVSYMWLRSEWDPQSHKFEEWVTGSIGTLINWCALSLVVGVYCGFLAIICFIFAITSHVVATVCLCVFVVCSVGPLVWGFQRWWRLCHASLEWRATIDGPVLVRPNTTSPITRSSSDAPRQSDVRTVMCTV